MNKKRYVVLDCIRGLTLISMIAFHTVWDMVYMFGVKWSWYKGTPGYIWQQSICWCFILLSGFCWSFGKNKWKRGSTVFLAGALVSAVTLIAMPENAVIFGVLTLLGSCMLLMIPLDKLIGKWNPYAGFLAAAVLFILTKNVNDGWLGFEGWDIVRLPGSWYANLFTTFIGFMERGFFSTDYFSLIPWGFLFAAGYFLHKICVRKDWLKYLSIGRTQGSEDVGTGFWNNLVKILRSPAEFLEFLGRHSLIIYLLHQPVIYAVLLMAY